MVMTPAEEPRLVSLSASREKRRVKVNHLSAAIESVWAAEGRPSPTRSEVAARMARVDGDGVDMWTVFAAQCPYCRGHRVPSWATRAMVLARFPEDRP